MSSPDCNKDSSTTDAFPSFEDGFQAVEPTRETTQASHTREKSDPSFSARLRSASNNFQKSNPPVGFFDAAGSIASSVPSIADQIHRGSYGERASLEERYLNHLSQDHQRSPRTSKAPQGIIAEDEEHSKIVDIPMATPTSPAYEGDMEAFDKSRSNKAGPQHIGSSDESDVTQHNSTGMKDNTTYRTTPFENGYEFPPKHTGWQSTIIGCKALWKFTCTWFGFLVVVYALNVVAWGGMIFLLLCNAAPAMCTPSCNDINSPRRKWIEIDAQVLTALFCVTGFGLIPWRFRDLWYLMKYRLQRDETSLRRLAGIHRGLFRLAGSQDFPAELGPANIEVEAYSYSQSSLPFPLKSIPDPPLTGCRAPATPIWKLDFVIWMYIWNTFLQAVLSGIMWGLNRYNRPSWATGLFVALACIVAAIGGGMVFLEGKKVKGIEGVPVTPEDHERLRQDREAGVIHYNTLAGKPPKEKKVKKLSYFHKTKRNVGAEVELGEQATRSSMTDTVGR